MPKQQVFTWTEESGTANEVRSEAPKSMHPVRYNIFKMQITGNRPMSKQRKWTARTDLTYITYTLHTSISDAH